MKSTKIFDFEGKKTLSLSIEPFMFRLHWSKDTTFVLRDQRRHSAPFILLHVERNHSNMAARGGAAYCGGGGAKVTGTLPLIAVH